MSENDLKFWEMVRLLGALQAQVKVLGPENDDEKRKLKRMLAYLKKELESFDDGQEGNA